MYEEDSRDGYFLEGAEGRQTAQGVQVLAGHPGFEQVRRTAEEDHQGDDGQARQCHHRATRHRQDCLALRHRVQHLQKQPWQQDTHLLQFQLSSRPSSLENRMQRWIEESVCQVYHWIQGKYLWHQQRKREGILWVIIVVQNTIGGLRRV